MAYVGGGFGHNGLHNILEPLVFSVPIIFGPNYHKFPEAKEALEVGTANSIGTEEDFEKLILEKLSNPTDKSAVSNFCLERSGASKIIFEGIKAQL
jgi:3-deoxy-D-manno-octulosonic-acid transferase